MRTLKQNPRPLRTLLWLVPCLLAGCTGPPDGVIPVTGFELDRYLGSWYEIARLDHRFERGLSNVTAEYALRDQGGISVVNRGFDDASGEWREARGKAFFLDDEETGMLKVSFFGPFYGGYNVIALDEEGYAWSMVVGPNRSYLWILARSPDLDAAVLERLIAQAAALDFPVDELIRVTHDRP
jgi:apolipoprotein D and lipocalin family protein